MFPQHLGLEVEWTHEPYGGTLVSHNTLVKS
jgi:hypothetical protein